MSTLNDRVRERTSRFCALTGVTLPLMNAPMADIAGVEMAAAVSEAGGLGVLAADFMTPEALSDAVADIRRRTSRPFAVHLRAEIRRAMNEAEIDRINDALVELKEEIGAGAVTALPDFSQQFDALLKAGPAVAYVSFGGLREAQAEALRRAGIRLIAAATTLREAKVMRSAEADAVVVQGAEAGGPRLTFEVADDAGRVGLLSLIGPAARATGLPVIASGGLMTGAQIAGALVAGAGAVELGTALLRTEESRAHPAHQAALSFLSDSGAQWQRTTSGRLTRGVRTGLVEALEAADVAAAAYPEQWMAMRSIELAARRQNRDDLMEMACGQGAPLARTGRVADVVATLVREGREAGLEWGEEK